jgi:ketosteroid isomerase-like protein
MGEGTGVFESWQKAMLAGDADAVADLYEDGAVLLLPSMEILARGKSEIRDAWASLIAAGRVDSIDVSEHDQTIVGDVAYSMVAGVMKGEMGGEPVEIPFRATEVQRRGADGTWRYVLDHG